MNSKNLLALALLCCFATIFATRDIKPWTVLIYIAADNDLSVFKDSNINQMKKVGSNKNINIVLCVNSSEQKYNTKKSQIVLIEKNNAQILKTTSRPQGTDSGNPEVLIDFCEYALREFPAEKNALIFWDHGTGALDPFRSSRINTSELFLFNPENEAHSSPDFLGSISIEEKTSTSIKAICFDDSTGNFLTEKKLLYALEKICSKFLNGKKFNIIGFDACLMAMIEVGSFLKNFADLLVASEEVELGAGWDYKKVLMPFLLRDLLPEEFGAHIVDSYAKTYSFIDDFTLSCVNLEAMDLLEKNILEFTTFFKERFAQQNSSYFLNLIKISRYKHICTHFDEPDYIDLQHFYENMLHNLARSAESNTALSEQQKEIVQILEQGISLVQKSIIKNQAGSYFSSANGLSIYFPEYSIHRSYKNNSFATKTSWFSFLRSYFF